MLAQLGLLKRAALSLVALWMLTAGTVVTPAEPDLTARDLQGTWVLRSGDVSVFEFRLFRVGGEWAGTWYRPTEFVTDGEVFWGVVGPIEVRASLHGAEGNGTVELAFEDPKPGEAPDRFTFKIIQADQAEVSFLGFDAEPFSLTRRSSLDPAQIGPWERKSKYAHLRFRPSSNEIQALFKADQDDRVNLTKCSEVCWIGIRGRDRKRRMQAQALIDSGALNSGSDFYAAAFIFQHGETPRDYLKAHILATLAIVRGNVSARWIAAASLDRYLNSTGQAQVFGTQFSTNEGREAQLPFDSGFISERVRQGMGVFPARSGN